VCRRPGGNLLDTAPVSGSRLTLMLFFNPPWVAFLDIRALSSYIVGDFAQP
jgi:hypothetical protein